MNYKLRTKHGLSLMEEVVVVAVIAMFVVLGLPAIRAFIRSVESGSSARAMISAALSSGRAIAARQQHYAGVRFQNRYQQDGKGCQYMIFIVHDFDKTGLANGFRAVEGLQPIKLPDSVGVTDLRYRPDLLIPAGDGIIDSDIEIGNDNLVRDTTTFSIIFSPSGKLIIHDVRVRNKNGQTDDSSKDDIFNTKVNVEDKKIAMFYQDDYTNLGLGQEASRNSFIIYDKTVFEKLNPLSRYNDYLKGLEVSYINPYSGTMINK